MQIKLLAGFATVLILVVITSLILFRILGSFLLVTTAVANTIYAISIRNTRNTADAPPSSTCGERFSWVEQGKNHADKRSRMFLLDKCVDDVNDHIFSEWKVKEYIPRFEI